MPTNKNLEKWADFWKYNLPTFRHDMGSVNRTVTKMKTESVLHTPPMQSPGSEVFTDECYQSCQDSSVLLNIQN